MSSQHSMIEPDLIDATEKVPDLGDLGDLGDLTVRQPSSDPADVQVGLVAARAARRTLPPPIPVRGLRAPSQILPVSSAVPPASSAVHAGGRPPPIPTVRARTQSSPPPIPVRSGKSKVGAASGPIGDGSVDIDLTPVPQDALAERVEPRARLGTLPPPSRPAAAFPFVVYPAPAHRATGSRNVLLEPSAAPVVSLPTRRTSEEFDIPTPLPQPYVDQTSGRVIDDSWFEATRDAESVDASQDFENALAPSKKRWLIALALFVSVIAVVALSTRAYFASRSGTAVGRSHAVATAPHAEPAVALQPDPATTAVAPQPEPAAAPQPEPAAAPQPELAVAQPEPAVAPHTQVAVAPQPEPAVVAASVTAVETQPTTAHKPVTEVQPQPSATREIVVTSNPPGATVTLIDQGTMTTLGPTPTPVKIDPSRKVDLAFTLEGHATKIARLDPASDALAVELTPTVEPKRTEPAKTATSTPARSRAKSKHKRSVAAAVTPSAPAKKRGSSSRGDRGTLMVSTKPPCEIAIDGVATVLTTPQRALPLPPGNHKITLQNPQHKIDVTIEIVIEGKKTTKLVRDFTRT